jgi:putative flippase GtrA
VLKSLARFLCVGFCGLGVDSTLFATLAHEGAPEWLARAVSLGCATCVTWRLNRRFTFGPSARAEAVEGSRYGLVAACAQGFNYTLFLTVRAAAPWLEPMLALLVCAAVTAVFSFSGQRWFTFGARWTSPRLSFFLLFPRMIRAS